jgi:hypothetical protein
LLVCLLAIRAYLIGNGASENFLNFPVSFPMPGNIGNSINLMGLGITGMFISDLYLVKRNAASNGLVLSSFDQSLIFLIILFVRQAASGQFRNFGMLSWFAHKERICEEVKFNVLLLHLHFVVRYKSTVERWFLSRFFANTMLAVFVRLNLKMKRRRAVLMQ